MHCKRYGKLGQYLVAGTLIAARGDGLYAFNVTSDTMHTMLSNSGSKHGFYAAIYDDKSEEKIYTKENWQKQWHPPVKMDEMQSNLALDQNLYRSRLRAISARLESLDRILKTESMSDEALHVENTAPHQTDSPGPGVAVPILEL